MKKLFIETTAFTKEITNRLDDATYAQFQKEMLRNPDCGVVMPGCGGLRKVRLADPKRKKGKRGGARIIYLHVPEADWILLLDIYDKGEQADLTPGEKKVLKNLAQEFNREALRNVQRRKGSDL
jgi:mRNA-degrading endonuclease RelE of RelBE toxin-antitoxin system